MYDFLTFAWQRIPKRLHSSSVRTNFKHELFPLLALVPFALGNLSIFPLKHMEIILVCTCLLPKDRACCSPRLVMLPKGTVFCEMGLLAT